MFYIALGYAVNLKVGLIKTPNSNSAVLSTAVYLWMVTDFGLLFLRFGISKMNEPRCH